MTDLQTASAKLAELKTRRATMEADLAGMAAEKQKATQEAGKALATGITGDKALGALTTLSAREAALVAGLNVLDGAIELATGEYQSAQQAAARERAAQIGKDLDMLTAKIGAGLATVHGDLVKHAALVAEAGTLNGRFRAGCPQAGRRIDLTGIDATLASYDRATDPAMGVGRRAERQAAQRAAEADAQQRIAALGPALPPLPDAPVWRYSGPMQGDRPRLPAGMSPAEFERVLAEDKRAWQKANGVPVSYSGILDTPQPPETREERKERERAQSTDTTGGWGSVFKAMAKARGAA
jgi:hypothetical protein